MQPLDEHDHRLLTNVHPSGWKNPEPASCYNIVVIGAGTAGLVTAAGAAGLGAKVALVENGLFGGDCLNAGCVPSKSMIRSARAAHDIRTAGEFGAACGSTSFDFGRAMERVRRVRAEISVHDSVQRFSKQLGIDVFLGPARFTGRDAIEVAGKRLRFKKAAVCTGSRPAVPSIPGIRGAGYLTNETVFDLTQLPSRLAIIGGGPIGAELAQAFARMGNRVVLLEQSEQILPREDPDAAAIIRSSLERDGVAIRLQATVQNAAKKDGEKGLVFEAAGKREELAVDEILVAVGRTPAVKGLDLEKAGIAFNPVKGVIVNDRLQTSNPRVYAAGDVCSDYKFTHTADAMARIVIANALFMARQKMSSLVIPWCTYTDPELAHIGMYEKEATDKGIDVVTLTVPLTTIDRAVIDGGAEGFGRVHLRKGTDKILGATIVARHAGEMISELTLAMTSGAGLSSVAKTIHPYPSQSEVIKKLGDEYNKTRLTPLIKKILSAWLKWKRV